MAITATIKTTTTVSEVLTNGSASATLTGSPSLNLSLLSGTGANQIDKWWEKKDVIIAPGGSVTYTLSALTDDIGRAVAYARVKELLIDLTSNTNVAGDYAEVGNAASHPWTAIQTGTTPVLIVLAGGFLHLAAPLATAYVVTSGTSDQLKINNPGSNPLKFSIYTKGCSV